VASNEEIIQLQNQQKRAPTVEGRKAASKRLTEIKAARDLAAARKRHTSKSR
jgi:hypothetical protein